MQINGKLNLKKFKLIISGLALFLILDFFPFANNLDGDSLIVFKLMFLMFFFWISEAIPISITALFPIFVIPIFTQIDLRQVVTPYASPVVFLLLGGFLLALGFEKSKLHERIALKIILLFGNTKRKLLFCVIVATAFFSMWLSNTATCLLMLPIIKSILESNFEKEKNILFKKLLVLSIAYSASIGGMMTPIGTIPNAIFIGFLSENYDQNIDFFEWILFVSPIAIFLLVTLWLIFSFKIGNDTKKIKKENILKKYLALGNFSYEEKVATLILCLTAFLWIFKSSLNLSLGIMLSDTNIAIFGGVLFFIFPGRGSFFSILDSAWHRKIPWNVLILFGGGLSLASAIVNTGLSSEISNTLDFFGGLNIFLIILIVTFFVSFLTEFTSNTATTILLLPILGSFALNNDLNIFILTLPSILAASCAFMMPISTPPNAIVYSSGLVKIPFMLKTGFVMNLISVIAISFYVYFF